jgi:glycosyltransferase involved in cell wall biosynthesis
MSMGLPVISTNWSGITAYLDDSVGYPISIEGLVDVEDQAVWWFKGLKWAQPSVAHLRLLMRRVVENRGEAAAKGRAARQRMVDQFSPEVLARQLHKEFRRIEGLVPELREQ